ncbi:hypothetical protein CFR73_05140 [Novacetimonas maltaceti]|nr:hypothetical protein CFR73_05140 [Novacetimonas maltaceti]
MCVIRTRTTMSRTRNMAANSCPGPYDGAGIPHHTGTSGSHQTQFCLLRCDLCRFMLEYHAPDA